MPVLYSRKEIHDILRELKIRPIDEKVDGEEAAHILSWRAEREQGIKRAYTSQSVRRHISLGNITPHKVSKKQTKQPRHNLYAVEDIFLLPLAPKRGTKPKEPVSDHA